VILVKKRIPYGIGDFEKIRKEHFYYVDKTQIIKELEKHQYPFFIRPRRFGKSLLISTLEHYYDIEKKDAFDELFKGLWIHEHPTEERNSYLVLRLDFSGIETDKGKESLFNSFLWKVKMKAIEFVNRYDAYYTQGSIQTIQKVENPSSVIDALCTLKTDKQIYLLIDEYDNFANDLIGANEDNLYYDILSKTGFVRTFYEAIKSGAQEGAISRIFMTGVSPIMLDDLTSGFNIAKNITLEKAYNTALGFTQKDVEEMTEYYNILSGKEKEAAMNEMKNYYNGYLFNKDSIERLYNPDMVLHFMDSFKEGYYPDDMIDMNVRTDYGKLHRLVSVDRMLSEKGEKNERISRIEKLLEEEQIHTRIVQMFSLERIGYKESFISLMYYMGLLTIKEKDIDEVILKIPNLVVKKLFYEYIRERYEDTFDDYMVTTTIKDRLRTMVKTGEAAPFIEYTYNQVIQYISNRDLIKLEEKHIKMILMSFLSITQAYIPYSELEMNKGYADIVLVPDTRYNVQNSQIWELKYIKENEDPKEKIEQAKEQIKRYEQDTKFQRLAAGTTIFKTIILAYKDRIEILKQ